MALDGRRLWQIEREVRDLPAISPDGKRIAFGATGRLSLYDIPTAQLSELGIEGQRPSWAPGGDRLAYDDGANPYDEKANVYVYDVRRKVTSRVGQGTQPSWLPDGERIAVYAESGRIDLVNLQTGARQEFLAKRLVSVPRWSPNGRWMMYTYQGGGRWWSLQQVVDPHQIMLRDMTTGEEMSVGGFAKANPGDYTWVANRELCRDDAAQSK